MRTSFNKGEFVSPGIPPQQFCGAIAFDLDSTKPFHRIYFHVEVSLFGAGDNYVLASVVRLLRRGEVISELPASTGRDDLNDLIGEPFLNLWANPGVQYNADVSAEGKFAPGQESARVVFSQVWTAGRMFALLTPFRHIAEADRVQWDILDARPRTAGRLVQVRAYLAVLSQQGSF